MHHCEQGMFHRLGMRGHRIDGIAKDNALSRLESSADFLEWASGGAGSSKEKSKRHAAREKVRADIAAHNDAHDANDRAVIAQKRMKDGQEGYVGNPLVAADAAARGMDVETYTRKAVAQTEANLISARDRISITNEALRPYRLEEEHPLES